MGRRGTLQNVRCPVAKEVGMGNPAEKTTRHPTVLRITRIRGGLASFFRFFWLAALGHRGGDGLVPNCAVQAKFMETRPSPTDCQAHGGLRRLSRGNRLNTNGKRNRPR